MDQDALVVTRVEAGSRLIEALAADGFEVRSAFWAKPAADGEWFLYLASPAADDPGPEAAYQTVHRVVRQRPDLGFHPLDVRVIGMDDPMTRAAVEATKPRVAAGPFAVPNPKPYRGMTRYGGSTFGGLSVEGVLIYPTMQPAAAV